MNKLLKILLATEFLTILGIEMLGPIYAIYVVNIGGDLMTASWAWAIWLFASGVGTILISKLIDKSKHQDKILIASYFLKTIGVAGYFFVANPIHLFIVQLVLGLSRAVGEPTFDSVFSKAMNKKHYAEQWGMWEGMYNISAGIAAIIGGIIVTGLGFKILFLVMTSLSFLGFLTSIDLLFQKKKLRKKDLRFV